MGTLKIRKDPASNGEKYKGLLEKKGFHPVRFGMPSPVGRVVKGTLVACGKGAWWLLGRLYVKRDE